MGSFCAQFTLVTVAAPAEAYLMQTITLADAQARLPEVIDSLVAAREIAITRDNEIIAILFPKHPIASPRVHETVTQPDREAEPADRSHSVPELKTFSVGKVLKPIFDRGEVWDEMTARKE